MVKTHISVQGLNVFYDGHQALRDITVDIPEKQITVIIGPSGCGKTTFLRSLDRLIDLVEGVGVTGRILFDGANVLEKQVDILDIRKRMGLIAQMPDPLPMSIYDNVAYGPRIHGLNDKKELDETVESCLKVASLWSEVKDRLAKPAAKLSAGQQQRLCLARALAVKPEVLLCDEPTSALDPISAGHIEKQLVALKRDYTIVFVTHVLRQARRLADYVIFLYLGELIEHGPTETVLTQPSDPRTKAYVEGAFG